MSSLQVKEAEFVRGSSAPVHFPKGALFEVAFIGRSNVGKSTLINRLTGRKKLARTSATPGRTQEINFFRVFLRASGDAPKEMLLADLPGFGYARFSKEKREELSRLAVEYLISREQLRVVCLLNDVRRLPEEDELAVRELAFTHNRNLLVVLTKADKLKKSELKKRQAEVAEAYGLEPDDVIVVGEKLPITPLWERIMLLA